MRTLIELRNVSKEYKMGNQIVRAANNLNFTRSRRPCSNSWTIRKW